MKEPGISTWRSEAARRRFVEMEDEFWHEQWPDPPAALDIDSFAGTTRLYRWSGQGDPIVFLHGMGGTSLTWTPYIDRLTGRDVFAVDTIGDVGRSEQRAVIEDAAGLARWLSETLTGADIERAHLVGTSYGGYLALDLAVRAPEQVLTLTVIDTGGLAPFRLGRFMLWGLPMLFGALAPDLIRRPLARMRPMLEDPRVMRMALHGQRNHPYGMPAVEPFTDDELRSVTAPTVAIVAANSAPFSPQIQAQRARLMPNAHVDVIQDAGHEVSWTHVDRCLAHIEQAIHQDRL